MRGFAPLGRLNPNFSYRVLDGDFDPVDPGEIGELWLGGPCVGLGYINNPEETARRFHQDPLTNGYRSVMYRTGDLVQEDRRTGVLSFRGRADNQIKLHGHRVELEEDRSRLAVDPRRRQGSGHRNLRQRWRRSAHGGLFGAQARYR